MMGKDFTVTVYGERGEEFERVFGSNTVHVLLPYPSTVKLDGVDEPQAVYFLDADLLTPDQHAKLVTHLAQKFATSERDVEQYLSHEGLPIRAADSVVSIQQPQKWLLDDDRATEKIETALFDEPLDDDGYPDYDDD